MGMTRKLDYRALHYMKTRNIQPFILNSYSSVNNQINDNKANAKLKSVCNDTNAYYMLKDGTTNYHLNTSTVYLWKYGVPLRYPLPTSSGTDFSKKANTHQAS